MNTINAYCRECAEVTQHFLSPEIVKPEPIEVRQKKGKKKHIYLATCNECSNRM